jgi:hypothetical protein
MEHRHSILIPKKEGGEKDEHDSLGALQGVDEPASGYG